MARAYPITRTIKTQIVTALIFDKETAEASNTTVIIPDPISDKKKLEKAVADEIDKGNIKFIEIVDIENEEALYGISMADFMAHAVKLNPETRKPISE